MNASKSLSIDFSAVVAPTKSTNFATVRSGADRTSEKVTLLNVVWDANTKSIKALCSDGKLRTCRVDRLPTVQAGRNLWKQLQEAGLNKTPIAFTAAGGFTPDSWFYTISK